MAIARKPQRPAVDTAPTSSERKIEALIGRGGSVAVAEANNVHKAGDATAKVVLRIPADLLGGVDDVVKERRPRIPRHTWILEAIVEKLHREQSS